MLTRLLIIAVALTVIAPAFGAGSLALFTDSDAVTGNTIATGTVNLTVSPSSAVWTSVSAAVPGDRATGTVTVTNGNSDVRYAITSSNTNVTLAAAMNLRIGLRGGGACDFPYFNTDGTTTALTDDTQLYSGSLNTTALVGSVAQGAQAGDRALAPSASEVLCVSVVLPLSAGNSLQGLTNTTTFTFESEQTANNP